MSKAIIDRALIVGGGFSGMTAAIDLSRAGIAVDLLEIDQGWRAYGAGISVHGAMLRVMLHLGLLNQFTERGAVSNDVDLRHPITDAVIARLPTPPVGEGLPGGGGIMRPVLAEILRDAVRAAGVNVHLGQTFQSITPHADRVDVTFTDGSSHSYDLVIGADGVKSDVRRLFFPDAPDLEFMKQGVWRAVVPRDGLERPTMWISGSTKAGLNLVSRDEAYLFLMESRATNAFVPDDELIPQLSQLLAQFQSPILSEIRRGLSPSRLINYRPLERLILPRPWHRGRIVLIGDAVHATTPHLAAGACIGVEDAVVLAEELCRDVPLDAALTAFADRRWERCNMVVGNSARLCEIEVSGGDPEEHAQLMRTSMALLAQPI